MNTANIDFTVEELSWLSKGLNLIEQQEEERDAVMNAGLLKQAESSHYADDLAENAEIVKERDELLLNLHNKLIRAIRETAAK